MTMHEKKVHVTKLLTKILVENKVILTSSWVSSSYEHVSDGQCNILGRWWWYGILAVLLMIFEKWHSVVCDTISGVIRKISMWMKEIFLRGFRRDDWYHGNKNVYFSQKSRFLQLNLNENFLLSVSKFTSEYYFFSWCKTKSDISRWNLFHTSY